MHLDQVLLAIFLLLTVVGLAVAVFTRLGLGSVLGLLVAGFVVGPAGFAITQRVTELRHLSELGVVLLLFIIGLEMQPGKLSTTPRFMFISSWRVSSGEIVFGSRCRIGCFCG